MEAFATCNLTARELWATVVRVPAATGKQATTGDERRQPQLQPNPPTDDVRMRLVPETFWTRAGVECPQAYTKGSCKNALIATKVLAHHA